jgi:hypothetical protein
MMTDKPLTDLRHDNISVSALNEAEIGIDIGEPKPNIIVLDTAYLHEAHTYNVLLAYPQYEGWIHENCVQLRWANGWLFTYIPQNIYTGMPFLYQEWVDPDTIKKWHIDVVTFVKNAIDSGEYIAAYVDESYIPEIGGSLGVHNLLVFETARSQFPPIDISRKNYAAKYSAGNGFHPLKSTDGIYHVGHMQKGAYLIYEDVDFYKPVTKVILRASVYRKEPGSIEMYLDQPYDTPAAVCQLRYTGKNEFDFKEFRAALSYVPSGNHTVLFVIKASDCSLESFWFE